jgi:O-acetylserine/cysteine efflux transporter
MGGGNFAALFIGLQTASPSAAAVVLQLGVPMTTLLSWLMLGEKLRWRRGTGIALTFAGAMLVMWNPDGFALSTGLIYIALAAFLGSLGAVMMKQVEGVKPLQFQAWVGFSSIFPLTALSAAFEPGAVQAGMSAGWPFVAAVVFSAVVVSVVAHTAYYGLIQRHDASLISPLTLMTPLATILLGVVVTNDPFGWRMAVGTVLALAGVLIIALRPNRVMPLLLAVRNRDQ